IVRSAAWSKTWSYVLRVAESFCLVRRASTWVSRCLICRSSNIERENERPGRLRALWASEDVDRFRDETAPAHVARLGLRVAVLDVTLFVLELPDLDDAEVALADPHP